jgi:tetratricopeptide (TPR) repeat protein
LSEFRIVFHDEQGNPVSRDELSGMSGQVGYQIVSDRALDPQAQKLHEQGRAAGEAGDYDKAIELLAEASMLDPQWPYPLYDLAFTHLLAGDAERAESCYRQVEELAPRGFFASKAAADSLRREREGVLSPGIYLAFVMLEWEPDAQKKGSALLAMLEDSPAFPAGWRLLATMLADPDERMNAIEQGLGHAPDAKTRGDLLIQKAIELSQQDRSEDAVAILEELLADPERTLDSEAIGEIVLSQIRE